MRLARLRRLDRLNAQPEVALQLGDDYLVVPLESAISTEYALEQSLAQALGETPPLAPPGNTAMLRLLVTSQALGPTAEQAEQLRAHAVESGDPLLPADQVRLLLPIKPLSLRDFMAWEAHYVAASRTMVRRYLPRAARWLVRAFEMLGSRRLLKPKTLWYREPIYYKGNPRSFVGPDAEIAWPAGVHDLDFELEIGFVLGRSVRDASPEQAESAIAAYTIFNDFTARDLQVAEMQSGMGPAKSKDFDTGNAMGPVLVTADEMPPLDALRCRVLVNGQVWADTTSAGMRWHPAEMVAYASRGETLYPGEFFGTGTVAGCSGVELDRWLQPGDEVELEVEALGTLRNRIGPCPA